MASFSERPGGFDMAEVNITKDTFEAEVTKASVPVVVDFWAPWCGPCKMLAPELAKLDEEQDGKIKVCKVNVDDEQDLAAEFGIMGVPTLLIYKDGMQKAKKVGYCKKEDILSLIMNS